MKHPRLCAYASPALISLCLALPVQAQSTSTSSSAATLPTVTVTGSRFVDAPEFGPIAATIVTAQQIRDAGIVNVNEAIRKLGNVYGRQGLTAADNFSLDLRGFGATSDQNMVVMVDGIRLSEAEQAVPQLSAIPIESVERIEIVRGGNSVLYGDGATGGTIQIITKRAERNTESGSAILEAGSFNHRAGRFSFARDWDGVGLNLYATRVREDGYRQNSWLDEQNLSGSLQKAWTGGRMGVRLEGGSQDFGLPGSLTFAQFAANPRQTAKPNDFGYLNSRRVTAFGDQRVGEVELAAELSEREKQSRQYGSFPFAFDTRTTQFSPRARWLHSFGNVNNELVSGVDLGNWWRNTSGAIATQDSKALYLRDEVRISKWRLAAGGRQETFDKRDVGYRVNQVVRAWELQAAYKLMPKAEVYGKLGQSYRLPTADDNAFLATPLLPQTSHDHELGTVLGDERRQLIVRLFRHDLRNEIMFDPTTFSNVNLDPTRRQGVEVEGKLQLSKTWSMTAAVQHVDASFTAGPNAGHEMILVPANTASLRANWNPGSRQSANIGVRYASQQRFGDDFSNSCSARIPAYAVLDARYAWRTGPWEFAATGTNLTDRSYYSNAFSCSTGAIYPEAGRQLRLSARMDF